MVEYCVYKYIHDENFYIIRRPGGDFIEVLHVDDFGGNYGGRDCSMESALDTCNAALVNIVRERRAKEETSADLD
jgi:hypothetical protein